MASSYLDCYVGGLPAPEALRLVAFLTDVVPPLPMGDVSALSSSASMFGLWLCQILCWASVVYIGYFLNAVAISGVCCLFSKAGVASPPGAVLCCSIKPLPPAKS